MDFKIPHLLCYNSPKVESTLFVPAKLTFSEYLRCLNFPLWILWPAITKQVEKDNLFRDTVPTSSTKFKHFRYSENVSFAGTNDFESILVSTNTHRVFYSIKNFQISALIGWSNLWFIYYFYIWKFQELVWQSWRKLELFSNWRIKCKN